MESMTLAETSAGAMFLLASSFLGSSAARVAAPSAREIAATAHAAQVSFLPVMRTSVARSPSPAVSPAPARAGDPNERGRAGAGLPWEHDPMMTFGRCVGEG